MFEQSFKNIDNVLWKDAGVGNELDYVEQTSWILFLKYLDDLEKNKQTESKLDNKVYKNIIDSKYRWEVWAVPKTKDGKIDHNKALSGEDLKDFVDHELFPYLKSFKSVTQDPKSVKYKIGVIFEYLDKLVVKTFNYPMEK